MEVELKYSIKNSNDISKIFDDEFIKSITEDETYEEIPMKAVYFDTVDRKLLSKKIAFRTRSEGSKQVATLKWGGGSKAGLHIREEINVPILDEKYLNDPKLEVFRGSDIDEILNVVDIDDKLVSVIVMDFLRKQVRIDNGETICELSIDEGKILSGNNSLEICELEIELYSGKEEGITDIGRYLKENYSIIEEDKSKFQRGLELIYV